MWFKKKKQDYFYESFTNLAEYSLKEIKLLTEGLREFDNTKLVDLKNNVHALEHEADQRKKEIEEKLAKEFITPIDREDIFVLLDNIDDLNDAIDEISFKLYMRNYQYLPQDTDKFMDKAIECCEALMEVLKNFQFINKKEVMDPLIKKVLEIEEVTDKMYEAYVHTAGYLHFSANGSDVASSVVLCIWSPAANHVTNGLYTILFAVCLQCLD